MAEAALVEAGIVECGAPLHLSGGAGPWDQGTMGPRGYGTKGPQDHGTKGPWGPWALRAHGPWALRAQGWALWARWALRAQLSPCRYAEDDFFAPYMRSKVCPILVAPSGMSQVKEKPWTVESQQRQLLREMVERSEVLRQT